MNNTWRFYQIVVTEGVMPGYLRFASWTLILWLTDK